MRSLIITGWDPKALALGFGVAIAIADRVARARLVGDDAEADANVRRRVWPVASGVAWRTLHNVLTTPCAALIPGILFPLFFFTAFAGGLSQVEEVPGFDYPGDYTSFQFVFVLLQAAAFGGVFTGFGIARDFEGGFGKRLLLASPNRLGILVGFGLAALVRWVITGGLLTVVALVDRDGRRRQRRSTSSASTPSRCSSTSAASSGRRASPSASARSRPGR